MTALPRGAMDHAEPARDVVDRSIPRRVVETYCSARFARFAGVGVASFVVDAGTLYVLHGRLRVVLGLATTVAYAVGFVANFVLNRFVTFVSRGGGMAKQGAKYLVLVILNYVWTLAVVAGLSIFWHYYLISKAIAAAGYSLVNFVAYKHWVFGHDGLLPPAMRSRAREDEVDTRGSSEAVSR